MHTKLLITELLPAVSPKVCEATSIKAISSPNITTLIALIAAKNKPIKSFGFVDINLSDSVQGLIYLSTCSDFYCLNLHNLYRHTGYK